MLKITLTHYETYAENFQPNPIRWRLMYKYEDGSFVDQAAVMKCKDFFNDVVAKVTGNKCFSKYSFDNSTIKSNKEGIYILLTGIQSPKTVFAKNIKALVNPRLKQDLGCEVSLKHGNKCVMLLVPSKVWTSTYYISLLSLLIRGCNYNEIVPSWEQLFKLLCEKEGRYANPSGCGYLEKEHCKALSETGFKVAKAEKYWFYQNEGCHNEQFEEYSLSTIVHNNGVVAWYRSGALT